MTPIRPIPRRALLGAALSLAAGAAAAHHGWAWAEADDFTLDGVIVEARLGMPHGILAVEAEGGLWTVEVGQPWRNAEAGLEDAMLAPGVALTVIGHRARDPQDLRVKAERVVIGGRIFDLYPARS
jgi:hypothetical protein